MSAFSISSASVSPRTHLYTAKTCVRCGCTDECRSNRACKNTVLQVSVEARGFYEYPSLRNGDLQHDCRLNHRTAIAAVGPLAKFAADVALAYRFGEARNENKCHNEPVCEE
jgi:hypothetical protein